jgi:hypothetical protein
MIKISIIIPNDQYQLFLLFMQNIQSLIELQNRLLQQFIIAHNINILILNNSL